MIYKIFRDLTLWGIALDNRTSQTPLVNYEQLFLAKAGLRFGYIGMQ